MSVPKPVAVDFETLPIEQRPFYPPPAVGVSIKHHGKRSKHYAWGYAVGNNCSWAEARDAVAEAYGCPDGVLFQNAKFDLDVAEAEFGLALPSWDRIHDTMLLLFLDDPHQQHLGLKESAERLLSMPPGERDAVADWLIKNQPLADLDVKISASKSSGHYFGAYISLAPGSIVGKYADGDVIRTERLFKLLWPRIQQHEMGDSYDRERRLLPILLRMEQAGIAVDAKRLSNDVSSLGSWAAKLDDWILKRIKAPTGLNLNSGPQLVDAMLKAGVAKEELLGVTKTGKPQTNKDALVNAVTDTQLLACLRYRAALHTCLDTFMRPWLKMANLTGGWIHTTWNQVRAPKGSDTSGARTGRLSATWFMNMPKEFPPLFKHETADRSISKKLPSSPLKGLPALPRCRSYIIPFDGHVLTDRDYSQQEPRILAHFDGGSLLKQYTETPWIDFHDFAKVCLEEIGLFYDRRPVKNTNLGLIYGMGIGKLAERNGMDVEEAKRLKDAILMLYPGLSTMYKEMSQRAALGKPIRTWGGRLYYCEEPRMVNGRWVKYDYKLVNVLIQGSAADCTKQAIIELDERIEKLGKRGKWFIILNVHDQLVMSVPKRDIKQAMEQQRQAMEGIKFDVPMLTEGDWSATNWGEMKHYDKKGKLLYAGR